MSLIQISQRARKTPASPIRKLSPLAEQAKAAGTHIYHLNIGQPDIKTPPEFFAGLHQYQDSVVAYDSSEGNNALRSSWSHYINATLNLSIAPQQMLITMGASEAIIFSFMTCCDPGDEVIIFDPTYSNYIGFAAVSGVRLVPLPTNIEENFALPTKEIIESAITPKTKAILLCNPNNPTGTVYSKQELAMLLRLCNEHHLFLIADETYREFVYDGLKPLSMLHLDGSNERVIIIDSLSKRFSLCGARLGCIITVNESVLEAALHIAQARLASPTIEQVAAAHMLDTISENFLENVRSEYEHRRNVLLTGLQDIPGITSHRPQGAFYTLVKLPFEQAEAFAAFLLGEFSHDGATTFVAPGQGFYMAPEQGLAKIRLAYVLNDQDIAKALEIIKRGITAFS